MLSLVDTDDSRVMVLAEEIRKRRAALRMSQVDFAKASGLNQATVRRLEKGQVRELRSSTKSGVEVALQWLEGNVNRILDGTATPSELAEVVEHEELPSPSSAARGRYVVRAGPRAMSPAEVQAARLSGTQALTSEETAQLLPDHGRFDSGGPETPMTRAIRIAVAEAHAALLRVGPDDEVGQQALKLVQEAHVLLLNAARQ